MTEKEAKSFNLMLSKIARHKDRFLHLLPDTDDENSYWTVCLPLASVLKQLGSFASKIKVTKSERRTK